MWKRLIDASVFEESYAQKLNASFRYLDEDNNDYFSLKDLIQKGYFVFSYLSIDVEQDSSFAVMDLFRLFDRSGRGTVNIEEFVVGVVEKLLRLKRNSSLISSVVDELLSIETRPLELASKLDKLMFEKLPVFRSSFKAFAYVVKARLKQLPMKTHDHSVYLLSRANMPSLIHDCIDSVVSEIQYYFHLVPAHLSAMLTQESREGEASADAVLGKAKSTLLWNLAGARAVANALDLANNKMMMNQLMQGEDDEEYSKLSDGDDDNLPAAASSLREASLVASLKRSRGGEAVDPEAMPFDLDAFHLDGDLLQILRGDKEVDESQLFLLQTAFRSIDSYFHLAAPPEASDSFVPVDRGSDPSEAAAALAKSARYAEMRNNYKRELAASANAAIAQANHIHLGSSSVATSRHTATTTHQDEPSSAPKGHAGFEYELVRELCESQDQLRKMRMRTNILEMVQSHILGSSDYFEEVNKEGGSGAEGETDSSRLEEAGSPRSPRKREDSTDQMDVGRITSGVVNLEDLLGNTSGPSDDLFMPLGEGAAGSASSGAEAASSTSEMAEEEVPEEQRDAPSPVPTISFESIMGELSTLKACIVERASAEFPLGYLLENEVAVVPLLQAPEATPSQGSTEASPVPGGSEEASAAGSKIDLTPTPQNSRASVFVTLGDINNLTREMQDMMTKRANTVTLNENIVATLKLQQEKLNELRAVVEQTEVERSEFMSLTVELQIIREKNIKLLKDDNNFKKLQSRNNELVRHNRELEDAVAELKSAAVATKKGGSGHRHAVTGEHLDHHRMSPSGAFLSSGDKAGGEANIKHHPAFMAMEEKHNQLAVEHERTLKELTRMKSSLVIAEQRVKGALQDQMALHHQLQASEEDTAAMTANVTKLTRDLEDLKMNRTNKEEYDRRLHELQHEINRKELELVEFNENVTLIGKLQSELTNAERVIEVLENKVNEYSIELERGAVAIGQIDNYREQIRAKTKENRDMSLHIHGLETQLKDVPYLQNRYHELNEELQDCKMKMENIPGLLSEIARLRGSSRASVKALIEQDKLLVTLKNKIKMLEKENIILKNDNRSLLDVENKLKESNGEIKRLLGLVSEVSTVKTGLKNAEEEKKAMETQNKRLKKFVRNSVITLAPNNMTMLAMRDAHGSHDPGDANTENTDGNTFDEGGSGSGGMDHNSSFHGYPSSPPPPPTTPSGGQQRDDGSVSSVSTGGVSSKIKGQLNSLLSKKRGTQLPSSGAPWAGDSHVND